MMIVNSLATLIEQVGDSKYRFAKRTGISLRAAYLLLNDPHKVPSGDSMTAICRAYNIQPGDFLKYVPDEQ